MDTYNGLYNYNRCFYTGTVSQPDTLTIFVKKEEGTLITFQAEAQANIFGKTIPILGSCTGIARIVNSVKAIFENLKTKNVSQPNEKWNAFKNLIRGIVEFCPLTGIFLLIFDVIRNQVSFNSKISNQIQLQKNIAGVAMDGEVILNVDIEKVDKMLPNSQDKSYEHRLAIIKTLCLESLKMNKRSQKSIPEIIQGLKLKIDSKQ